MSGWARALEGDARREAGYRLHRLGLGGVGFEVTPGYARNEERLRASIRMRMPPSVPWTTVAGVLAAEPLEGAGEAAERAWYERRLQAGEGGEVAALIEGIAKIDAAWTSPTPVTFVVSPALRALPCFAPAPRPECGGGALVAAGPGMPATLALLGAIGVGVERAVMDALPEELPFETRHFVVCMVAGTLLVKAGITPAALDVVLGDATRVLIPPQHRDGVIEKRIVSLSNRGLLDQPPGEIDRMIHGLARRRADRLLRAWQRGFFVPRGMSLGPGSGT